MSKLSDLMRRAARTEARPVGFTAAATRPRPTMLVIAELHAADLKGAATSAPDADALLVAEDAPPEALSALAKGGAPVGVRLERADRARVAALRAAGVDFIVIGDETAASALTEEGLSFILSVNGEPSDTELRTLDALPVEALSIPAVEGALTIRRSVGLRRVVAFARKPLMLPVEAQLDADDLEALRELNVLLLLAPAASAATLRERVLALPPRRRRREESNVGVSSTMFANARDERPEPDEPDHDHDHD